MTRFEFDDCVQKRPGRDIDDSVGFPFHNLTQKRKKKKERRVKQKRRKRKAKNKRRRRRKNNY